MFFAVPERSISLDMYALADAYEKLLKALKASALQTSKRLSGL